MPYPTPLTQIPDGTEYDVVVLGAGGAGMSAALFAAIAGAKVLLVESTAQVGGTSAYSAATTWIPGTHLAPQVNKDDTPDNATRFLDNAVGARSPRSVRDAFVANGAAAVKTIEDQSHVKYRIRPFHPDYLSELEGSTLCGRALEPLPFDGRLLGEDFGLVRPPIPEFMVLGGMMVDRDDIPHMLGWNKSVKSAMYVARVVGRHLLDRLRHPRGTRLLMGNALIGRMLLSLRERGVTLLTEARATALQRDGSGPVNAVTLEQKGLSRRIAVRGGVVLASGGFNRHPDLRAQLLPGADIAWCPAAPGHTAEAHALARDAGAVYGQGAQSNAFWAPVSLRKRADGSTAVFPHFVMDRAKPGMLTVNRAGQRFVNESTSYHLFGMAMQATGSVPAYLVCDATALQKYGIGMVRPGASAKDLAPFLADGYLTQGATLDGLAQKLGIDAAGLKASVDEINRCAETGVDPRFHRGETAYQQNIGDASAGHKNPNLGPLTTAPYYAVRLHPGDIGAATGFATDTDARVLDASGQPIPGLYAVGNDMHSVMGGVYTAPGITIGPGLVFGFLAARHAGSRAQGKPGL